jgi:pyrrolysine biosynthesis protein PylD
MTRLTEEDLRPVPGSLHEYEAQLKRIVGVSLRQVACMAAGVEENLMGTLLDRVSFAAVPVSSGLGVIHGFSHAVSAIVSHLGFESSVTGGSDVSGVAEGMESGADVLFLADDRRFVALVPAIGHVVDNSRATAQGFVAGLELMKGGLAGESVLVVGCGPVGKAAAKVLVAQGASVAVCDVERSRARSVVRDLGRTASSRVRVEDDPADALGRYELVFDASDSGGFIEPAYLTARTLIAAPGMPCALTPEAMVECRARPPPPPPPPPPPQWTPPGIGDG